MTPKISLITATVGAALVFAVPAWGMYPPEDTVYRAQPLTVRVSPDLADRAEAVQQQRHAIMLDARERALGVEKTTPQPQGFDARSDGLNRLYVLGKYAAPLVAGFDRSNSNMLDARERALVEKTTPQPQGFDARSDGPNRLYVLGKYAAPLVTDVDPVTVSATSSGRDVEWPTIGIGFGIGIVLVMGLAVALKATRNRPLAH